MKDDIFDGLCLIVLVVIIALLVSMNLATTSIRSDIAALQSDVAEVGAMCKPEFYIHNPATEPE